MSVSFFTFKWGDKYGPEYPNRLYVSLMQHCKIPFDLTCITDDTDGLLPQIHTIDYDSFDPFKQPKDRIFTREKLVLFKEFNYGRNVWLDLDILIHDDITDLVITDQPKPVFIWNYWTWDRHRDEYQALRHYGNGSLCYMNSSFVYWQEDAGEHIFDSLWKDQEMAFWTYNSLDKYLFYQHWHRHNINFWNRGLFYNYNWDEVPYQHRPDHRACIFNTSHIKTNNIKGLSAYELHEAKDWVKEIWESYDTRS